MANAVRELARLENFITPYEKLGVFYAVLRHAPSATSEADDLIHFFILVLKAAVRRHALADERLHAWAAARLEKAVQEAAGGGRARRRPHRNAPARKAGGWASNQYSL